MANFTFFCRPADLGDDDEDGSLDYTRTTR